MTRQFLIGAIVVQLVAQLSMAAAESASLASKAGNDFAFDLYAKVNQSEVNACISPYSVSSALGMTDAGARGKTQAQILSMLHWVGSPADLAAADAALNSAITRQGKLTDASSQITIANALFGQRGYPYRQAFLDLLSNQYGAALQSVDFAAQPQQACDQINQWAAEKTHNRIKQAVPRSALSAQTRLVLVDAIYFKANWEQPFSKSATQALPFFHGHDAPIVATMQQLHSFQYMENDLLQVAELPYGGDFSMVILLPRDKGGLITMEKSLSADAFADWLKQLSPQLLKLYLPKFHIEGSFDLTGDLQKMGMTDAFDARDADFSGMVSAGKVNIDRVIHKTFISVDEAGTEAAAVTSVTMRATAMMPSRHVPEPIVFRADHPFLFVIRHRSTGAILFIGKISEPR